MGDDEESAVRPRRRSWVRWLFIGLGTVFLLLIIFHAPLLRTIIRTIAIRVAAGEHLKLDFRLEGDPVEQVILRNLHVTPTGPTAVQGLEAGLVKVEYSLPAFLFHGMAETLKNVEVHDLTGVIDPSKAPPPKPTPTPKPNEKASLPTLLPDRLEATNLSLTIKGPSQDTVIQGLSLGLYPDRDGSFRIEKLEVPSVHRWVGINATTSYRQKNLLLRDLTFDEKNRLQVVNVDTSQVKQGKLRLELQGALASGTLESKTDLVVQGRSYHLTNKTVAQNVSLRELAEYLGQPKGKFAGDVSQLIVNWQGQLDAPVTWNGTIAAESANLRLSGVALDRGSLKAAAGNGRLTVREAKIDRGTDHVQLTGSLELPQSTAGFGHTPGKFQLSANAPDLKELTAFMTPPASGSLQANGTLAIENDTVSLDLTANGDLLNFDGAAMRKLTATISANKKMPPPNEQRKAALYEGLISRVDAELEDLRYGEYAIDKVQASLTNKGQQVTLTSLSAARSNNLLHANGSLELPAPGEKLMDQPADLQFSLGVPQLSDYWNEEAANKVSGQLQADGTIRLRKGIATGSVAAYGQGITANRLLVKQLDLQASLANNTVYLNDLTASLNAQDYVAAHGQVSLQKPYHYTGKAVANLVDLSAFEPLLNPETTNPRAAAATRKRLAGSLVLNWNGAGDGATFQNRGDLLLKLEHGRYAELQNLQANIESHYTPEELNVPIIYLGSDKIILQANLQAKGSTLEISKIQIDQGTAKYATAYAALPFTWSNLGTNRPVVSPGGKVALNLVSENLDIAKLFQDLGMKSPASGSLSVKLDATGPLDQLQANLDLQMQNLEAAAAQKLEPAKVAIGLRLANNQLNLLGKIEQAKIQPVQIDARLPLNVSELVAKKKLDEQTPVTARIQMPRSSMNFVREFVPSLRQLDGTLALNVNVGGTIANPALSGTADTSINIARFENATLPALTNFGAQVTFRENTLSFDRFGGDLAGGPFRLTGRVTLQKLTEPNFDLRLTANSVLVARNDNLTARVDADLKVEGPMNGATVSGQVLTTNSRFFKDIDIIPIGLPGRPPPHPEPPSAAPNLSFPDPPLRDCKFDLVIKSKDPFLIRGNLATGSAVVDMRLTGTGLKPQLEGQVRLDNFDATLPFSTLTINLGFLYFDPDEPFNPRLELQGTSLIRDYTIHAYIYGTANSPQAVFSSEPPLPQEEIISLLATGTTREELSGGNVLASRAAILLVKQLYRKIFKKGSAPEQNDSFFSRLDVEFGNTDPRTGEQTATARYKLTDHFVLIGDLGVQGGFRGMVKYLIRFR